MGFRKPYSSRQSEEFGLVEDDEELNEIKKYLTENLEKISAGFRKKEEEERRGRKSMQAIIIMIVQLVWSLY